MTPGIFCWLPKGQWHPCTIRWSPTTTAACGYAASRTKTTPNWDRKTIRSRQVGTEYSLDPSATFAYWQQFLLDADEQYQFGSEDIRRQMEQDSAALAEQLRALRQDQSATLTELAQLERNHQKLLEQIAAMPEQREAANQIIERYEEKLTYFLEANREDLLAYFRGADRLDGFGQDGENRASVANQVESLYGQIGTIQSDRQSQAAIWMGEVEKMWDGYEFEINSLANSYQTAGGEVQLVRPFDRETSQLSWINRVVPWFDLTIGGLLMIGLFSRLASLLGAGFLASVIAAQPPWVFDAQPVFYQGIELVGLLVVFATCAGRYAGADYFTSWIWNSYFQDDDISPAEGTNQ